MSLLARLLLCVLPAAAHAQEFLYTTTNGVLTITRYTGARGDVIIPGTITGLPVISIGSGAFSMCTNLTSITIPNSVTNIGDEAFSYCTSLISVMVPNSVTAIGRKAFSGCTRLSSVTIPENVTAIEDYMFSGCTRLTSVTIGNSVTTIGDGTFWLCTSLTSVTIPNSVTNIGEFAFLVCSNLTSVTIPNSVTAIGYLAFSSCSSLNGITVDALNSDYSSVDGILFNRSQTTLIQYPGGKGGSYTVPRSVTSIGDFAFASCTSLTSVRIPDSTTAIGYLAFSSCSSLKRITVDALNSVYSSVDGVLFKKNQATLIQYPGGKGGSYTAPTGTTSIGDFAFAGCTNLTGVTIPDSVTAIGWAAFSGCTSLTSVTIPNSVTFIGYLAFSACSSLTGLYFHGNAPSLGEHVFSGADKAIVYYLPATTGWSSAFRGRPTAPWRPRMQAEEARFGVNTNSFRFTITWARGQIVVVEACTNLTNPVWSPLQTNTLGSDLLDFSDPDWTNHPARLYRLRAP